MVSPITLKNHLENSEIKFDNVNNVSHDGDLAKYDIIVCAMNLTESNHSYFDNNFFDRIKKGC